MALPNLTRISTQSDDPKGTPESQSPEGNAATSGHASTTEERLTEGEWRDVLEWLEETVPMCTSLNQMCIKVGVKFASCCSSAEFWESACRKKGYIFLGESTYAKHLPPEHRYVGIRTDDELHKWRWQYYMFCRISNDARPLCEHKHRKYEMILHHFENEIPTTVEQRNHNWIRALNKLGKDDSIRGALFFDCVHLSLTHLPESVTSEVSRCAFAECKSLALDALPPGLRIVRQFAFSGCTALALAALPAGVTKIGEGAFEDCVRLRANSLPDSIVDIGPRAFRGCESLALTSLPESLTHVWYETFDGCRSLALSGLSNQVGWIGPAAFRGCRSLSFAALPEKVTELNENAFSGCTGLALAELPEGVTRVRKRAFLGCSSLTLTRMPRELRHVDSEAFRGCTLMTLHEGFQAPSVAVGWGAFADCHALRLPSMPPNIDQTAFLNTNPSTQDLFVQRDLQDEGTCHKNAAPFVDRTAHLRERYRPVLRCQPEEFFGRS